ncbi:hypothetical protein D3C81_1479230 [compost metagenome]
MQKTHIIAACLGNDCMHRLTRCACTNLQPGQVKHLTYLLAATGFGATHFAHTLTAAVIDVGFNIIILAIWLITLHLGDLAQLVAAIPLHDLSRHQGLPVAVGIKCLVKFNG